MAERKPAPPERYPPIADHGVIGDLSTVALVGLDGAIDFFCFPEFDSPSAFARLLDHEKGGVWSLNPTKPSMRRTQIYLPDTNVLVTRFLSREGILELTDFMTVTEPDEPSRIVRLVRAIRGEMEVDLRCAPAFDYAANPCEVAMEDEHRARLRGGHASMTLTGTRAMKGEQGAVSARFTLRDGETEVFTLTCGADASAPDTVEEALAAQAATEAYWRKWLSQSTYRGRWSEMVGRSALVLKLLCSRRHGSLIAAATFGLPEDVGGPRNWDYRYCWIRDAAFTIYAFIRLGFFEEANAFTKWVTERVSACGESPGLALAYRIDGSPPPEERTLDHLEGYDGSRPVRVGNAAAKQVQLDIYGELLDAVYLIDKHTTKLSYDTWEAVRRLVEHVRAHWEEPDAGIWEFRAERKHFLHSRLMCWVAIDRAHRVAQKESLPAPLDRWRDTRDKIFADIHENFWDEEIGAFVQHKGAKTLDAAALMMPLMKFISPRDPRWLSTLDAIRERLASDVLVHRYDVDEVLDGFKESREGAFTICSFWYVECLARSGRAEEARLLFEKMLSYANHVGLYSEELGIDGAQLGNFPQAFTHLALISAAYAINEKLPGETPL